MAASEPRLNLPLFGDGWVNDSGYDLAVVESLKIDDPTSLLEIRTSAEGMATRGIKKLEQRIAELDPSRRDALALTVQMSIYIGLLHMSDGAFAEADAAFARAQTIDPAIPPLLHANIEVLRGIAALRRGETENCVACCNGSSCIFPLSAEAVHQARAGSEEAARRFLTYLEQRPEDLGVQWLLNIAHMTLGTYPAGVPERFRLSLDAFQSQGDIGRFPNIASRVGLAERGENLAGGVIVDDFNGDSLLDVFYSCFDPARGCSLYLNQGDGTFADATSGAGIDDQTGALNCRQADYDNDGDLDVLVLRGLWIHPRRPSLLQNDGLGHFTDVTLSAGLGSPISSTAGGWADYDRDGDLDLYVAGEYEASSPNPANLGYLYRNNGDGTFTDVTRQAGVSNQGFCRGIAWGDYDEDGLVDLYLSNQGRPNRLFHNNGDGSFVDVAAKLGVSEPLGSFSCWFWDYDNDGRLDLFVANNWGTLNDVIGSRLNRKVEGKRSALYHNEGNGRFQEVGARAGLDGVWVSMGSNLGDLDNDGYLDFYLGTGAPQYALLVPNVLMHNVGGQRFEDITTSSGTGHLQKGHGVAFADWDEDGDVDLFLQSGGAVTGDKAHNSLFENKGHGNHWLNVKLVGTRSNRDGQGARIEVRVETAQGPRSIHRLVGPGSSFGNNPLNPTIGLGQATKIVSLDILWPTGTRQHIENLPLDRAIVITEGTDAFETRSPSRARTKLLSDARPLVTDR